MEGLGYDLTRIACVVRVTEVDLLHSQSSAVLVTATRDKGVHLDNFWWGGGGGWRYWVYKAFRCP